MLYEHNIKESCGAIERPQNVKDKNVGAHVIGVDNDAIVFRPKIIHHTNKSWKIFIQIERTQFFFQNDNEWNVLLSFTGKHKLIQPANNE